MMTLVAVLFSLPALVLLVAIPAAASETSVTIRPNGDFVVALWNDGTSGCSTDSSRWDELIEDPADGNTTCRATGTAGDSLQLSFDDPGSPARVIDIDVLISLTGRVTGGQTIRWSFFSPAPCETEAEPGVPADITSAAYTTVQVLLEYCATTTSVIGTEWTESLVNQMRADIDCVPTGTGLCFITQAYAEVRYTIQDEPGAPPPEPPPPLPEQIRDAAVGAVKVVCNLWLSLLLIVLIIVALVARHMQRSGDTQS